jgi:hypothetical protein
VSPGASPCTLAKREAPLPPWIAAGLGRREEAREALAAVRREFLTRDMAYDAALVTLELATLSIKEGRIAEVKDLAGEIVEIFRTRDVHREALAALTVFQSAALLETATAELAREVAASLTRARNFLAGQDRD